MDSSWEKKQCHFTWNLEGTPQVSKHADALLRKIKNNLVETDFLKIEHLLFKAYLQLSFEKSVRDALESLDKAKREIENRKSEAVYKGYKTVELLNRMWIEKRRSHNEGVCKLDVELKKIQFEEKDLRVVGAIKAAALMRLGPIMFDTNLVLFKAAHRACPSNPDFLFGVAFVTGQNVRFRRPIGSRYDDLEQLLKDMMDEEKGYWEKLIDKKPSHKGYHYAKSMLGLNLSRRDGSDDAKKALELLEEANNEAPDIHEVCRNLIRFLKKADLDRSISILENAISKQPSRVKNHHQLALCYIDKAKKEKKRGQKDEAEKWNIKALTELDKCLLLDSSHVYALLNKAKQLEHLHAAANKTEAYKNESPEDIYENMMQKLEDFTLDDKLQVYSDFGSYLNRNKSVSRYSSRFEIWQEVMNILASDESFERQNESGKWEVKKKQERSKTEAYEALKKHYNEDHLKLGILFYQNFEFDQAIDTLARVDQTNAEVPYYLAKTYLKKGQEKIVGDQAKHHEAAEDFAKARENVDLAREMGLEPQKVRKILADIALAIAHNELQINVTSVIQLENRCVTSYREAIRCGSLVAVLELMKMVERNLIKIISWSKFIQILAEIEVCCSQPQSDILHAECKPFTFKEGLRSKETDFEPSMLKNRKKIQEDINRILSKDAFFRESRDGLFNMEVLLLKERFKVTIGGADGLQLDGREEGPLEEVSRETKTKAVLCCVETRPLLDRIMDKFQKEELKMEAGKDNYFPLILKDGKFTPETFKDKLKQLTYIDMETHYPKIYECLFELQEKISAENKFIKNLCTIVNKKKHSDEDVLVDEPNPVKLARQSADKVEEICQVFFDAMKEATTLSTVVDDLVSAIRQCGCEEVDKANELFKVLMENEDFVVRMDNTWKFLEILALIHHCREAAGADVDLTRWTELSERSSGLSKELRGGYLEVEAALLTNGGITSSKEFLVKCHTTCLEADKHLNKSLQSEGNRNPTFPFPDMGPGGNTSSWKGKMNKQLKSHLRSQGIPDYLLGTILEAQPCSNEDNYHFTAMRKFLDDCSRGIIKKTVSIEKGTNSPVLYDVLDLTRWCVNHAEKFASKVVALKKAKGK